MSTWLQLLLGILLGFPLLLNSEEAIDPNEDDESYKRCANSETGERYREAETWTEYGRCAECMCMKAGPECHETECVGLCVEEGIEYNVGESWKRDACTTCACEGDKNGEMTTQCVAMSCLDPADCKTEVVSRSGECCPVCLDDCATVRCAMPSDCQYGIMYPPDQCCPVCKVDEDPNEDDESYKRCANSETGERYREAETWTEYGRCAECMCMKAGPECHETECVGPCVEEGIEYNVGESWKRDACTTCTCEGDRNGMMTPQCMVMDCLNPADCKTEVVSRSGECCPVCIDDCATVRCAMPSDCQYGIMYPPDQCCPVCKVDECADVYCPEDCGNSMVSGGCCPACDWQVSSSQNLARFTSVFVQTLMIISTGELCWT